MLSEIQSSKFGTRRTCRVSQGSHRITITWNIRLVTVQNLCGKNSNLYAAGICTVLHVWVNLRLHCTEWFFAVYFANGSVVWNWIVIKLG